MYKVNEASNDVLECNVAKPVRAQVCSREKLCKVKWRSEVYNLNNLTEA